MPSWSLSETQATQWLMCFSSSTTWSLLAFVCASLLIRQPMTSTGADAVMDSATAGAYACNTSWWFNPYHTFTRIRFMIAKTANADTPTNPRVLRTLDMNTAICLATSGFVKSPTITGSSSPTAMASGGLLDLSLGLGRAPSSTSTATAVAGSTGAATQPFCRAARAGGGICSIDVFGRGAGGGATSLTASGGGAGALPATAGEAGTAGDPVGCVGSADGAEAGIGASGDASGGIAWALPAAAGEAGTAGDPTGCGGIADGAESGAGAAGDAALAIPATAAEAGAAWVAVGCGGAASGAAVAGDGWGGGAWALPATAGVTRGGEERYI